MAASGAAEGKSVGDRVVDKPVEGIQREPVTAWLAERLDDLVPPLDFSLIAGGHSNLTFDVRDQADGHWVLRRPPLHQVLATAHDMGREHRIISALAPTDVPVPDTIGLCTDEAVNGSPFYVMDFVDGTVIRNVDAAEELTDDQRRLVGESVVDVLARIHAVDVDAVGLGDLGRKEAYIERQLKRWNGQFEKSKTREVPIMEDAFAQLSALVPPQGPAAIVHGDYRLDNCMIDPSAGEVVAVLDWEICTLGDPLADVGLLHVYWGAPDDAQTAVLRAPTVLPGFPGRDEALRRYAAMSGRDLSAIDYYVAFGYWKLACIIEGVYSRYVAGAMGGDGDASAYQPFAEQVEVLAGLALDAVARLS